MKARVMKLSKAELKAEVESQVRSFLSSAPRNYATWSGELKGTEKIIREKFAEKFSSAALQGYLLEKDWTMEFFIESQVVDRAEFCRLMSGEWIPKDDRPNPMSDDGSSSVTTKLYADLALGQTRKPDKKKKKNFM